MDFVDIVGIATLAAALSFVAGVVFHKYVISEASAIKAHVTAEVQDARTEIRSLLEKGAAKV